MRSVRLLRLELEIVGQENFFFLLGVFPAIGLSLMGKWKKIPLFGICSLILITVRSA